MVEEVEDRGVIAPGASMTSKETTNEQKRIRIIGLDSKNIQNCDVEVVSSQTPPDGSGTAYWSGTFAPRADSEGANVGKETDEEQAELLLEKTKEIIEEAVNRRLAVALRKLDSLEGQNEDVLEKELEVIEVTEEDEEPLLTEDAYSLLYTTKACSRTSMFAWFAIMLQGGMLVLIFLDLFDTSKEGNRTNGSLNRLEIPAGATIELKIAQFLGMLLTAMVMAAEGDFVIGVTQFIKGYDPKILQKSPYASWARWLLSASLHGFFGLLLLFDSFILSMQSESVIDLALNLTALHFIQENDNLTFSIGADTGLLGPKVAADCEHIRALKGYSTPESRKQTLRLRRCIIVLMTAFLLIPYFVFVNRQSNGHYTCSTLYVEFGDEYIKQVSHYSGLFKRHSKLIGQRPYYVDETGSVKVAFCNAENFWTVSYMDENACAYLYRSAETETFDIIKAAEQNFWFVETKANGDIDVDWLAIVCNDCTEETCPTDQGKCSKAGDKCECHDGRFGLNCQFQETCRSFALDQRTRDGLASIPGTSSFLERKYFSLPNVSFSDRPVYVPLDEEGSVPEDIDSFIIFIGRRWVMYAIPDENLASMVELEGKTSNWTRKQFIEDFGSLDAGTTFLEALQTLTARNLNYFPIFFSSPLNYGESSLVGSDPSAVTWVLATTPYNTSDPYISAYPDEAQPVSAKFLCSECYNDEMCLNGGRCDPDWSACICPAFYRGYHCERFADCVKSHGCYGAGECSLETGVCKCEEGSYGILCQLGTRTNYLQDVFFCSECRIYSSGHGECNSTFGQECLCEEGYYGKYCNETATGEAAVQFVLP